MSKTDRTYLLTEQYSNSSNLNTRINLHQRFSTNSYGWYRWVFDRLNLPAKARILELGCGHGKLWSENITRIPPGWQITLTDFSEGMLQEARSNLGDRQHSFTFKIVDAQSIPFEDAGFDAVIANHMLHHIPDRTKAFTEIHRVLRPNGRFLAATHDRQYFHELEALIAKCQPTNQDTKQSDRFTVEQGEAELKHWFSQVMLHQYNNSLIVTETQPLVDYVFSAGWWLKTEQREVFRNILQQELAVHGSIHLTSGASLLEAIRG